MLTNEDWCLKALKEACKGDFKVRLTWHQIDEMVDDIVDYLRDRNTTPDLIVGLSRGGLVPAVMLSHRLQAPMVPLVWTTRDGATQEVRPEVKQAVDEGQCILVVDDINDSGLTLSGISAEYEGAFDESPAFFQYIALVEKSHSRFVCDYSPFKLSEDYDNDWVVFPWEESF